MGRFALPEAVRPQRFRRKEGTINYSSGNTTNLQVGQTDYLTSLDLISTQTLVSTATIPVSAQGAAAKVSAFAALGNVQVKVNGGRAPFSLPGYHTDQFNKIWAHDYASSLTATALVASTTNNWTNHLRVPLTVDPASEKGAWYTADTQLNLTCALTFNAVTVVYSTANGATIGGGWDVYSEKFSAPAPDMPGGYGWNPTPGPGGSPSSQGSWLDNISYYRQVQLYSTTALSNGTTNINLETDQDIVRIMLIFYTGTLNANSFKPADTLYTSISLKVNDVALLYDTIAEAQWQFEYAQTYKLQNDAGTTVIDFMRLEPPTRRDIIPADADKVKRLQLSIPATSASNIVDVVVESMVDSQFALRWAASAKRMQGG